MTNAWWRRPESGRPLAGRDWSLHEARPPSLGGARRALLLIVAGLEVGVLGWMLTGPAFQLRHLDVTGATHVGATRVLGEGGLAPGGSVLTVDAATIRRKLLADPWVRDANVSTRLPDRVVVAVSEWQPVAVFAAGAGGRPQYLNSRAGVLGPAPPNPPGGVVLVAGPAGPDPRPGQRALDPRLLTALVNIQRSLPSLIGQSVKSFEVDGCGNLTMTAGPGWRALFGRVITPEEYAALPAKLGALKAIAGEVNFNSPDLDYVNVQNPALPATRLRSARVPSPSPSSVPSPRPSGAPIPIGTPTPAAPVVSCR